MKKLCYVISDVDSSHQLEALIKFTDSNKFNLSLIFLAENEPTLYRKLKSEGFDAKYFKCAGKKDLPLIFWQLVKYFGQVQPDIVHTHLFNASIAGLAAAKFTGVKQRIHTRHHSVEHHKYHPHAVYYDKIVNFLSTHIVAITGMVKDVLVEKENVNPKKITVVRHGFDWKDFENHAASSIDLKLKYGLNDHYPVIGLISRHIEWKGIQYTIPAFRKLLEKYPNAKLVLANAGGSYRPKIEELLKDLDSSNYVLIDFEKQVFELYKTFDFFVHVPIGAEYEAFGQIYVESLAMRIPSIFTLSGVASDFIENEVNALVVPYCDSDAIYQAMMRLLDDNELCKKLAQNGYESVKKMFHIEKMIQELENVYL
jgi:glycosyltransferase involved in cell wall biosynthesis